MWKVLYFVINVYFLAYASTVDYCFSFLHFIALIGILKKSAVDMMNVVFKKTALLYAFKVVFQIKYPFILDHLCVISIVEYHLKCLRLKPCVA